MRNVSKNVFLSALNCPTLGWLARNDGRRVPSLAERFRLEQGLEVGRRARALFPGGRLISPVQPQAAARWTDEALAAPSPPAIFEAAFIAGGYVARPDIIYRRPDGWHMVEVKSGLSGKDGHLDDMAYTAMVARAGGTEFTGLELVLVSRDYRLGMPDEELFVRIDHTDEVLARLPEFEQLREEVDEITRQPEMPAPQVRYACRSCDISAECLKDRARHHVIELPRLTPARFRSLEALGISRIEEIPDSFPLTQYQRMVRDCVRRGRPYIGPTLREDLAAVEWPARYLDFETVMTAIPLYPEVAPYEPVVTQYSLHTCSAPGVLVDHRQYLAEPWRDCRRELAENLLRDLGDRGSIIVYSRFEGDIVRGLMRRFPDLAGRLAGVVARLVDLEAIIRRGYYHPDFRGSTSIKRTLPALVPDMSYEGLAIGDGGTAAAAFAYMAWGRLADPARTRRQLLEYCRQDTLAMVKLHQHLLEQV